MTPKERLLTALQHGVPDRVPATPDISNMVPCRLTGKPFWDMYLYNDPPLWQAYIDAARFYGIDSWQVMYLSLRQSDSNAPVLKQGILMREPDRIITQYGYQRPGEKTIWTDRGVAYPIDNPPTEIKLSLLGLQPVSDPEPVEPRGPQLSATDVWARAYAATGDGGILGIFVMPPGLTKNQEELFAYVERPEEVRAAAYRRMEEIEEELPGLLELKPDFIMTGYSGMLVFMTPDIVRDLSLPAIQYITRECRKAGVPTMIHSCGRERELVKMCAEETDLDCINPLEIPPMGDCDLGEMKRLYGDKLCLMGNLHTTEVMLFGSVDDVRRASRAAIDAAGAGGGFILSTGDQCGRDTPGDNLRAMVEVCETYGIY